jgi:hypothetical protein
VAHHHKNSAAEVLYGIFHAGQPDGIRDVSRGTHDEEVTEALVEQDFGRHAAIGVTEDDGFGVLTFCERLAQADEGAGLGFAGGESLVVGNQIGPDFVW